jgi:hypothetical protein
MCDWCYSNNFYELRQQLGQNKLRQYHGRQSNVQHRTEKEKDYVFAVRHFKKERLKFLSESEAKNSKFD